MRGITPVIAIILLLLMAVAAAGGFYFVYQGFTEEGEESGATQIEQLGEQSLAQIQIESAAGGRLYVRNTGATTIDLSKSTVYVENQPVSVNRSSDTLAERSRAVLKLTEAPGCTQERCEVKISGAASTSEKIDLAKLSCSSDSDCYAGETCEGGVCIEEEEEEAVCGNGVCDAGEYGYNCFEDCYVDSLLLPVINFTGFVGHLSVFDWNGSTYELSQNLTNTSTHSWDRAMIAFSNQGNAVGASYFGPSESERDIYLTTYDGSSWSYPANLTEDPGYKAMWFDSVSADSSGNAVMVWRGMPGQNNGLHWATVSDGVASSPQMMADTNIVKETAVFDFMPDDNGYVFFSNETATIDGENYAVKYRHWDGSWGSYSNIATYQNEEPRRFALDFASNGDGMAVWRIYNATNHEFIEYATYDGSSWTYQGSFEPWTVTNQTEVWLPQVHYDHEGDPIVSLMTASHPSIAYVMFSHFDGSSWTPLSNFTGDPLTQTYMMEFPDNTIFVPSLELSSMATSEWQYSFSVWNGDGWAIERRLMETYP